MLIFRSVNMARYFYLVLIVLLVPILFGCEIKTSESNTRSFVIVDQNTSKVINNYEYSIDSDQLVRTESYNSAGEIVKGVDYEYDNTGNLSRTTKASKGYPTKSITYETEDVFDQSGRLIETIRRSSEGEIIETFYAYDDSGTLRGVVEQIDKSAVMMQDYDN